MADITLCESIVCEHIKNCLRSKYNGYFQINPDYQSYSDFYNLNDEINECEFIIKKEDF